MKNKESRKRLIMTIAVLLLIVALILAIVLGGKKSNIVKLKGNDNFKLDFTDKFVEDEFQKVAVTDISVAENYYFIKYDVSLKEKGKQAAVYETSNEEESSYQLARIVTINGEEIDNDSGTIYQISEKINDDTLRVYDIVKVDSIPDKFNISIDFIKRVDEESVSEEELAEDRRISLEHESSTIIGEDYTGEEDTDYEDEDEDIDYEDEELEGEELNDDEDAVILDMEPVEDSYEIEMAGTTSFQGTKEQATQNVSIQYLNNKAEEQDVVVNPNFIVTTPYEKFLIITTNLDNVYQDENRPNDPSVLRMDIQDENGNTQNVKFVQKDELTPSRKF